jgi:hypothetical protein
VDIDVVTLFSIVVFGSAWWFYERTARDEHLVRLFFASLMFLGAGAGVLGLLMRLLKD